MADAPSGTRVTREQWARMFLEGLQTGGIRVTQPNMDAVVAWIMAEGTEAKNNPLATTQEGPNGTTDFNSVHVKNYPTVQAGLHASLVTINNGRYGAILHALQAGNNAGRVTLAIDTSPWGTKHSTAVLPRVVLDRASAYGGLISAQTEPGLDDSAQGTIGIPNPVAPVLDVASSAAQLVGALLNPATWQRVALFIVGAAMAGIGVVFLVREVR